MMMAQPLLTSRLLKYTREIMKERKLAGLLCVLASPQRVLQNRGAIVSCCTFYRQASTQGEEKEEGQKKKGQETKKGKDKETNVLNLHCDIIYISRYFRLNAEFELHLVATEIN